MKLRTFIQLLIVSTLSACVPIVISPVTPTPNPPTSSALPDLVISGVYLGMQGVPGGWTNCVRSYGPFEIRATVQNVGQAPANNISIVELSTASNLMIGELGVGQAMELYFPSASFNGSYTFSVDAQNTITESNESNNTYSYLAPTPTPPALCATPEAPTAAPPTAVSTPVPATQPASMELSLTALRNGLYHSPDWGTFQLTDGVYYRTPTTPLESPEIYTTRLHDPIFYGDINMDGIQDALVILNTQNGGTGHFMELAAVINENGNANNVSTVSLGDRVVVEAVSVENGIIVLNMRVQGPDDGMCCPSQFVSWRFVLSGNQLIQLP